MTQSTARPRWLLALESSTPHGGAALARDGEIIDTVCLEEGLRHGRELVSSAAGLLQRADLNARELAAVAVSAGPGSYTGIRVGVMAAKALAYGAGCGLVVVSSLAALAQSRLPAGAHVDNTVVMTAQNARRDEVYAALYGSEDGEARSVNPDCAVTPEEAAAHCRAFLARYGDTVLLSGSGFATYRDVFVAAGIPEKLLDDAAQGGVDPAGVAYLGWRQLLREETADPMTFQPVYLRRDEAADWRHDHLITS